MCTRAALMRSVLGPSKPLLPCVNGPAALICRRLEAAGVGERCVREVEFTRGVHGYHEQLVCVCLCLSMAPVP